MSLFLVLGMGLSEADFWRFEENALPVQVQD